MYSLVWASSLYSAVDKTVQSLMAPSTRTHPFPWERKGGTPESFPQLRHCGVAEVQPTPSASGREGLRALGRLIFSILRSCACLSPSPPCPSSAEPPGRPEESLLATASSHCPLFHSQCPQTLSEKPRFPGPSPQTALLVFVPTALPPLKGVSTVRWEASTVMGS